MPILPIIEKAIQTQAPIRFKYVREGKTNEMRVGNPHAVFIRRLKNGSENVYVHLWQTDGASDSKKPLPSWRQCYLEGICEVEVLVEEAPFEISDSYNPTFYEFPVCIL